MKTLNELFNGAFFRIPDYQRGYAWEEEHLEDFWKDLSWLAEGQRHYTGLIALHSVSNSPQHYPAGASTYHVVDGQQRLTTCILLIARLLDRRIGDFVGENQKAIIRDRYLCRRTRATSVPVFGYGDGNDMRFLTSILESSEPHPEPRTVYERSLERANEFLTNKIRPLSNDSTDSVFTTLTTRLVFDVHEVKDDFDVCAMFESINYRGKRLTKFEVLKNRLIYLNELQSQSQERRVQRRERIDACWRECFRVFGAGENVLDEDEFLQSHTIMYFGPLEREKDALDRRLFREQWSPDRLRDEEWILTSEEMDSYISNIELSAKLWALQEGERQEERLGQHLPAWLERLHRLGPAYFKPLVLGALNWCWALPTDSQRQTIGEVLDFVKAVERFIFVLFELGERRSDFGSAYFLGYAQMMFKTEVTPGHVAAELQKWVDGVDGNLYTGNFFPRLATAGAKARFQRPQSQGYHSWTSIKYLLSEYREHFGENMLGRPQYRINSVERVMPQIPEVLGPWAAAVATLGQQLRYYINDLGNLTLLPKAANNSEQNASLQVKAATYNTVSKDTRDIIHRAGPQCRWGKSEIDARGLAILNFVQKRWKVDLKYDAEEEQEYDLEEYLAQRMSLPRSQRR